MIIKSYAVKGYEGFLVTVETDIRRGIPGTEIIGLPDSAVKEAKERVRAAIKNSGLAFPKDKILINLTPAGIKKEGSIFDLSIALAILQASENETAVSFSNEDSIMVLGELELSGQVRKACGVLSAMGRALECGITRFIVPKENEAEAQAVAAGCYWSVSSLSEALTAFREAHQSLSPPQSYYKSESYLKKQYPVDFSDIKGQPFLKRALEITAAGHHNLLFFGPPGCGKTMTCRAMPSILPSLTQEESLQVSRIYSIKGELTNELLTERPFRMPHHSASTEGIIGGGKTIMPGEASLAHNGILFLDEALEFGKNLLQNLREPLESKRITLARAGQNAWFPANFQLLLAANVCPCGNMGKTDRACLCSQQEIGRYWKRLGGAILDRIEIRLPAQPVSADILLTNEEEPSALVRERVRLAVQRQHKRYENKAYRYNADLPAGDIKTYCQLGKETEETFLLAIKKLSLSSRATHSILKVARTIADLAGEESITTNHVLEAASYRRYGDNDLFWTDI